MNERWQRTILTGWTAAAMLAAGAGSAGAVAPAHPASAPLAAPAEDAPLPVDPRLVRGQLDNGMNYIVVQHANPPGRATMYMHVSSGSLNEKDNQRGMAHYLEHMAFNGSKNFPAGTVVPFFQSLGMQFGRHQNAFTSFDQTTFILSLPNVQPETFDKGMSFFSDVAFRLDLDPKEIDEERDVIMEERRTGLGPQQRVQDYVFERIAPGSLFGQRIPIGVEETIRSVQRADFLDYYGRYYVPSNMTMIVVADADPAVVIEHIKKNFADGKKVEKPADQDIGLKVQAEPRAVVATDAELRETEVSIMTVKPNLPPVTTEAAYRADLVETIGSWIFNRRLEAKVNEGAVAFQSGNAFASDLFRAMRLAQVSATGEPAKWEAMLKDLATELQRARLHGFLASELADAQQALKAQAERAVQTESTRPAFALVGQINSRVASGDTLMSAAQELELLNKYLPSVQLSEISERFRANFDPANATFIVQLPAGADGVTPPSEADLVRLGVAAVGVTPPAQIEAQRPTQLLSKLPAGGNVADSATHAGSGVTSAWLGNGVRVHHRFMDIQKNQVAVTINVAGGSIQETAQNKGISEAAGLAWETPATRTLTSTNIRDLMTGKKVSVGGGAGSDSLTLTISGSPEDLEHGFQLAYLLLTEPKIEQAAFDQWKAAQRQEIEQMKLVPQGVLAYVVSDTILPKNEVRNRPLELPDLEKITLRDAQAWLEGITAGGPVEVAVVGDVSKDRALELTSKYLGSLSNRPRISDVTFANLRKIERPQGPLTGRRDFPTQTPVAIVIGGFFGADVNQVRDARLLEMSARILSTRMVKQIREAEQLVYSISASSRPGVVYTGYGLTSAGAPTDPAKAEKLGTRIHEMFADFAANGPTEDEMTVARKQFANSLDETMKQPQFWSGVLSSLDYRGRKLDDVMGAAEAFANFSPSELKEGFAKYYTPERKMLVTVVPVAPASAPAAGGTPAGNSGGGASSGGAKGGGAGK